MKSKCIWERSETWEEEGWITQCNGDFTLVGGEYPDIYDIEYCPFCGLKIEIEEEVE
ncbi:hypothetical protein [Aerococcus christensenii]|uniref:hypothetical protein n=1 Tax=Aerococcus christensenii TaxID=87541 RepID=UPI003F6DF977